MLGFSTIMVPLVVGSVAVVLGLGLFNLLKGGSGNTSQKLMRWRIGLQALALVLIMGTLWLQGR
jgi:hypothetical protein